MDKNRIFVVLMSALSVLSLGFALLSTARAELPGGGMP